MLLGHAKSREASAFGDASLLFLLLAALPWDPGLLILSVGRRADDDQLLVIGLERDASRAAFDHDVLGVQERDQVGRDSAVLQLRDLLTDPGVRARDAPHLGKDSAEDDVLAQVEVPAWRIAAV